MGMKRIDKKRMEKLRVSEGGSWCDREFHKEAGEELVKVSWARGMNSWGMVDRVSGCA